MITPINNQIKLRDYQLEAIDSLRLNDWRGIFEMATGTGKTFTSLFAAKKYYEEKKRIFLIIIVPYVHLINQWAGECNKLGIENILECYGLKNNWLFELSNRIRDFNLGFLDSSCIITSYKTAATEDFGKLISLIKGNSFLISDECHYFGIKSMDYKWFVNIDCRLGLSATPDRWWDEHGTKRLRDYFGDTTFEYDLENAIFNNHLVEYKYNPIIADLTEDEQDYYDHLTKRLSFLLNLDKPDEEEILKVNLRRSDVISKACHKKKLLYDMIKERNLEEISHTLIYCGKGEINEVTSELSKMGLRVHRFNHTLTRSEREKVLESFENGNIQALVAIKCLDEGVDVPSTKEAYFISSTSNPREFIQRRGRILRRSPGKNMAEIFDFIVLPTTYDKDLFVRVAEKELPRFAEFSRYAINGISCRPEVRDILQRYSIEHLMDKLPWEVYKENKERWMDFGN